MDNKLHLLGVGEIDSFGVVTDTDISVKVLFTGITLNLKVPKHMVLDTRGVSVFQVGENVKIDCLVDEENVSKSFENNTYVKSNMKIKRVVEFSKVKG